MVVVQPLLLHRCRPRLVVEEEEEEEEEEEGGQFLLLVLLVLLLVVKEQGHMALKALLGRRGWEGRRRRFCIKVRRGEGGREGLVNSRQFPS